MNKKIFSLILCLLTFSISVSAYELDSSVNKEIEQKYNSNKLNQDMKVDNNVKVKKTLSPATYPTSH